MRKANREAQRTCIGCMRAGDKRAMVRLACDTNGVVCVDYGGAIAGRGAYLHRLRDCLARFEASKVREFRSLKRRIDRDNRVAIVKSIKDQLDREKAVE